MSNLPAQRPDTLFKMISDLQAEVDQLKRAVARSQSQLQIPNYANTTDAESGVTLADGNIGTGVVIYDASAGATTRTKYWDGSTWRVITAT